MEPQYYKLSGQAKVKMENMKKEISYCVKDHSSYMGRMDLADVRYYCFSRKS